jgi:hypothetical protein
MGGSHAHGPVTRCTRWPWPATAMALILSTSPNVRLELPNIWDFRTSDWDLPNIRLGPSKHPTGTFQTSDWDLPNIRLGPSEHPTGTFRTSDLDLPNIHETFRPSRVKCHVMGASKRTNSPVHPSRPLAVPSLPSSTTPAMAKSIILCIVRSVCGGPCKYSIAGV